MLLEWFFQQLGMMMLSVVKFAHFEIYVTSVYLSFRMIERVMDEFNYSKTPDLFYINHPNEAEQLRTIAQLLIQFKDLLSDKDADKFNRLRVVNYIDCPAATIARMRFWSFREEYMIEVSENLLIKSFSKAQIQAILSQAVAHIPLKNHGRYHDTLNLLYDLSHQWLWSSLFFLLIDAYQNNHRVLGAELMLSLLSLFIMSFLSTYFKIVELSADQYAINHFGIRQEDMIDALQLLNNGGNKSFFSLNPTITERTIAIKKSC